MKTCLLLLSVLLIHTQCLGITCPSGQTVTSSDYVPTTNGCGSSSFQTMVADLINPYNKKFEGCCNTHDKCFGTCGTPNFKSSFDGCNSDFKQCMKSQCNKVLDKVKKLSCNLAYKSIYTAVDKLGSTFYDGSQKKACTCSA